MASVPKIELTAFPDPSGPSRFASLSHVRLKSSEARLNSARCLPIERLICGSFRGPKNTRAITNMKSSSVLPSDSRIRKTTLPKYLSTHSFKKIVTLAIVTRGLINQKLAGQARVGSSSNELDRFYSLTLASPLTQPFNQSTANPNKCR